MVGMSGRVSKLSLPQEAHSHPNEHHESAHQKDTHSRSDDGRALSESAATSGPKLDCNWTKTGLQPT
jgi:hypothetical protein